MTDQITTKPFASQAQAGWAFATGQPFAKRWARQTGPYKRLPYKVRKKALAELATTKDYERAGALAEMLALKGESLAPGVTRIHGDLCNVHGRWGSCSAAGYSSGGRVAPKQLPKAPKAGGGKKGGGKKGAAPRKTVAQRQAEQAQKRTEREQAKQQERAANRKKVLAGLNIAPDGQDALKALQDGQQPDPAAVKRAGLVEAGLAEQAKDGSYRLTGSGRAMLNAADAGDAGRAGSVISGARDRTTARGERQAAAEQRHAAAEQRRAAAAARAAAKKPALGGKKKPAKRTPRAPQPGRAPNSAAPKLATGGGGGTRQAPKPPQQAAQPSPRELSPAAALYDAVLALSTGGELDQATIDALVRNGLARLDKNGKPSLTGQGLRLLSKGKAMQTEKAGSPGDYLVVEDPAKPSTWHLQVKRGGTPDHGLMGGAWAALHGGYRGNKYAGPNKGEALAKLRKLYASEGMDVPAEKSFVVFKDATGADRWLSRTTTAYEDRDGEIISAEALQESADSPTARGPLRWWHSGSPNPLDDAQPWGPGVDLGWCDFAALSGRTLIESGTFKSAAIAQAVAAKADQLELSPGFFHAPAEPDAAGVFHHIRIFERSLVPTWAGRASNYYTGLKVQGGSMDDKKMKALKELGASDDVISALLADVQQTEKAADEQGVRYKAFDFFRALFTGEPIPTEKAVEAQLAAPGRDDAPTTTASTSGVVVKATEAEAVADDPLLALKAQVEALTAELTTLKAGMGGMGDMGGEAETPDETALEGGVEEPGDVGGLTLSPEDLAAIGQSVASALEPLIGALGITQKLEGHLGELKTMMGGYVKQKDDEAAQRANEIAALKASIDQQQAKLGELLGDQPRGASYRPTQASDNTLGQLAAIVKDADAHPNDFSDLTRNLFPGMLPG